jgi:predicted nucleotidyltransferase
MNAIKVIKDLKVHLLRNCNKKIEDVIMFGSRASGTSMLDSDLDVLLIIGEEYTNKDKIEILDLCYDINIKHDIILDVHLLSKKEINSPRGNQPFFSDAVETGLYA